MESVSPMKLRLDYIEMPLGGKLFSGRIAVIDVDDAVKVCGVRWFGRNSKRVRVQDGAHQITEYAYASNKSGKFLGHPEKVSLHRLVLGITDPNVHVDHINHDGLDCRKRNLRIATHSENTFNSRPQIHSGTSQFKGVSWITKSKKWRAQITKDYRDKHLGEFECEIDAAIAYDDAAMHLFGEFAYLNFPTRKVAS